MQKVFKKTVSILLALLMLLSPLSVAAVAAEVKDTLVAQLASVYGGDESRARSDLALLENAGIIDEDGNVVALDIREDGEQAELDALVQRIANGEAVGALTVNGNAVEPEQIVQIQQVSSILEMLKLIDKDVEITDAHVDNYKSLVTGLADGSIDLDEAISTGSLSLKSAPRKAPGNDSYGYETGDMTLDDGKFTAPMLDGDQYDAAYAFAAGPATTWYTDAAYKGVAANGIVTLTAEEKDSYLPGETVTVTASLSEAQTLPVSFDWKAVGAGVGVNGTASGTVAWNAGDTEDKTFSFTIADKADGDLWQGSRALVINASNIRNAQFEGNTAVWSKTVQVASSDNDAIKASYTTTDTVSGFTSTTGYDKTGKKTMTIHKKFTGSDAWKIPQNGNCTITVAHFGTAGMQIAIVPTTADVNPVANSSANSTIISNLQNNKVGWTDTTHYLDSASPKTVNVGNLPSGTVNDSGETIVVLFFADNIQGVGNLSLKSFTISARKPSEHDLVQSVSVPAGAYHSGEVVPVTVELDNYVKADANTVLTVNGESCALLDGTNTETKKLTFGYTVKAMDTGAVNVTALTGLKNADNMAVSLDAAFAAQSFGVDEGVSLVSDLKNSSIDWENVKFGVTDADANEQTVTVVLPLIAANSAWVASEAVQYNNGAPVAMPIPGYADATADYYVPGAYVSTDGGATRYPLYVAQSSDSPVALVARFQPLPNESGSLRKETLNLFMDPEIVTGENAANYLPALSDTQETAPFAATALAASIVLGQSWTYYLKGGVSFDANEFISRGFASYDGLVDEFGFLKLGDDAFVALQDAENPDNQYDVEIVVNRALHDALTVGARVEDSQELRLWYQFSSRKGFTFTKPEDFTLTSADTGVAVVAPAEDASGVYNVILTGAAGSSALTLTVGNGAEERAFDLSAGTIVGKEGKSPFLQIPAYSSVRTTLTNTDTDVLFSSNLTARNAAESADTAFSATLYRAETVGSGYAKTGDALWNDSFESTPANPLTHITVPGSQLAEPGVYALEISAANAVDGTTLTCTAYIVAKLAPAKVTLNKLDSYYVTSDEIPAIGYTVTPASATVEYTIQPSGESVSERTPASGGTIPFAAAKPNGLKQSYTITVYARNSESEAWSVDSMLLSVYNKDALAIIMADVATGKIGGTTGGTGSDIGGTTVALDNHGKVNDYLNGADYQLSFDDFEILRTDMSLQKIISANYGEDAWGMLSDRLNWSSSNHRSASAAIFKQYAQRLCPRCDGLHRGRWHFDEVQQGRAHHRRSPQRRKRRRGRKRLHDLYHRFPRGLRTVYHRRQAAFRAKPQHRDRSGADC